MPGFWRVRSSAVTTVLAHRLRADHPDLAAAVAAAVDADGYAVVEGVLGADRCAALVDEVVRTERSFAIGEGTNEFEGFSTRRIFDLVGKSQLFRELAVDPIVLPAIEAVLGPDLLLSGTTSMNIGPGETPQLLHADDGMLPLPRPHLATMVTTLWALSEFRADNGATHLVPGSHRREATPRPGEHHDVAIAEMPPGSVLILHGSTWHGGGHNTTTGERRYGLSVQYVAGWCRQQQNLMLGTPVDVVATYPPRLQELIGYSMFRRVMGHVDRKHPRFLLGGPPDLDTVWNDMRRDRPS